jgi:hypothetical protein
MKAYFSSVSVVVGFEFVENGAARATKTRLAMIDEIECHPKNVHPVEQELVKKVRLSMAQN